MIYLDSSAIVKLFVEEPESAALRRTLAEHPARISSMLARVETLRALRRRNRSAETLGRAEAVLERIALVPLDEPILRAAAATEPRTLRSLDAIHLATALSLFGLDLLVTYDQRLFTAAAAAGLPVVSPS